jgi:hypothetical protein
LDLSALQKANNLLWWYLEVGSKKNSKKVTMGWFPKEPTLPTKKINFNSEEQKAVRFQFNKRFWMGLAVSYALFFVLVVVPFLLGYINSTILGYGIAGIVESLFLIVMVRLLNDKQQLRKRLAYVVVGVWLGFAVSDLFGLVLFSRQFLAVGSWSFALLLVVMPSLGGLIGYWIQKRKFAIIPVGKYSG